MKRHIKIRNNDGLFKTRRNNCLLVLDVIEFLRNSDKPASRPIEEAIREYFKITQKRVDNREYYLYDNRKIGNTR